MNFLDFLAEASKNKTIVFAFGRFNPPTIGHELLVKKVVEIAKQNKANHVIYASRSQDSKKNPLSVDVKVKYLRKMFPNVNFVSANQDVRTFMEVAKALDKQGYKNLIMIAGSDRINEYQKLLDKYNGKEFFFDTAKVVSAGERDPDAEGASGMSGTKMREAAIKNDFKSFRSGIPTSLSDKDVRSLMREVRTSMNIREFIEKDIDQEFQNIISEGVHDQSIFKAVFLSGGPGSGKDYVLDNTLAGHGLTEINSDKAFEFLMDKENLDMKMPESEKDARDLVRKRAKNVTELRQKLAILGRNGLIINGTGDDLDKIKKIKERLEEIGYDTSMVSVNTSDEVSKQRNIERGQRGGRTVPEEIRKSKWEGVQKNRPEFAKLFGNNYMEIDNSEDLRTADENIKETKKQEMLDIFKRVREFTKSKPENENAQQWIANELSSKDKLKVSDTDTEKTAHPDSEAYAEAQKLGLTYYGFGRYGKNGKVTHHSVHDKLVEIGKIKLAKTDVPVGSSLSHSEKAKPTELTSKQKETLQKKKQEAKKKLPEGVDKSFETFINEAVSITVTGDTADEVAQALKLLKSEPETEDVEEQIELSSDGALNALLLGKPLMTESVDHKNHLKDKGGKSRKFLMRRAAAKEAHIRNGEVEKIGNHYYVKLSGDKNVSVHKESIQITEIGRNICEACGGTTCTCDSTETKEKAKKSQISEIDFGIEPGMAMAGYNKEKWNKKGEAIPESRGHRVLLSKFRDIEIRKKIEKDAAKRAEEERKKKEQEKSVSEMTGDETGASIGDQKDDELRKQGISLASFKAKKGNIS